MAMTRIPVLICFIFAARSALAAPAALIEDLYVAEVPVSSQQQGERRTALRAALGRVLVRVTGDAAISSRGGAEVLLEDAARYLQRYQYLDQPTAEGEPGLVLRAHFDGAAISSTLKRFGLPVWPERRAQTLLWFALVGRRGLVRAPEEEFALRASEARTRFRR